MRRAWVLLAVVAGACGEQPAPSLDMCGDAPVDATSFQPCSGPSILHGQVRVDELSPATDLSCVQHVIGDLIIENTSMVDLAAFRSLRCVDGHLVIWDNPSLRSLNGLDGLQYAGNVGISDNALSDLRGLGGLERTESLGIGTGHCGQTAGPLRSLAGLDSLSELERLRIYSAHSLETLDGFPALDAIPEEVFLEKIPLVPDHEVDRFLVRFGPTDWVRTCGTASNPEETGCPWCGPAE